MKYFIITSLLIFLGVMYYIDIVSFLMPPAYFKGIHIVPVIMAAEVFFGIIFNLSLWYKLTDRTQWGAYLAIFGFIIRPAINKLMVTTSISNMAPKLYFDTTRLFTKLYISNVI